MKSLFIKALLISLFLGCSTTWAAEVPEIIQKGFDSYKTHGPRAAITKWLDGSPLEGSKDALAQANSLRQIEEYYGRYQDFSLYKASAHGPRANVYLLTIHYEMGVVYAKFYIYKINQKEFVLQRFAFNTEADKVWPASLIYSNE